MCSTVKSPTPKDPVKKDPVYLRNLFLDGLGINAEARGRNSLRIDPGSPVPTPGAARPPFPWEGSGSDLRISPAGAVTPALPRGLAISGSPSTTRNQLA